VEGGSVGGLCGGPVVTIDGDQAEEEAAAEAAAAAAAVSEQLTPEDESAADDALLAGVPLPLPPHCLLLYR
jgi:hypothetical protein